MGIFGKKTPVPENAVKEAYDRARRVRTVLDVPSVADIGAVLWITYGLREYVMDGLLPEWSDLAPIRRRDLEMAYWVDVLDDYEILKVRLSLSDKENARLDRLTAYKGEYTAANLFKELGVHSFDPSDFDEIEMPDILDWLQTKAPRDPAIWHLMPNLNWGYVEIWRILRWVVEQPECDAATAIDILDLMQVDVPMDIASGGTEWLINKSGSDPKTEDQMALLKTICLRSEDDSFPAAALKQGYDHSEPTNIKLLDFMRRAQEGIKAAGRKFPYPLPVRLLSRPIPRDLPVRNPSIVVHDNLIKVPKA